MTTSQAYSDNRLADEESRPKAHFLQRAVQWDAGILTALGIALLFTSEAVATYMGIENPAILAVSGLIVLLYDGGRLIWSMVRKPIDRRLAAISFYGNAIWAILSIPLLVLEVLPLSNGGWWIMAGVADFAALFAVLQWVGLRK